MKRYVAPAAVILAVCMAVLLGAFERLELGIYDYWFRLRGEQPPGNEIIIVAIDEKSIERIGPLPWPRSVHARLLDVLQDARVVGFDLLFDVQSNPDADTAFSNAVKRHGRVVLASSFMYEQAGDQWHQKLLSPIKPLAAGSSGIGFINMPEDIDGVIRNITAVDINTFKRPYPCLSMAIVLAFEGLNPNYLRLAGPGVLQAGNRVLPVDRSNKMLLNFWGGTNTFETLSYADVLAGNVPPGKFKDKIVLIGNTSPLVKDEFRTPFSSSNLVLSGSPPTPGVEIHASAVKTILDGVPYRRAGTLFNLAVLVCCGVLVTAVVGRRGPWVGLGFVLLLTGGLAAAAGLTWLKARLWLNMAALAALVILLYTTMTLQGFLSAEKERRRTRAMFGRYVSPAVMEELLKNPDLAVLGGQRREVTILFVDIRGFTSYSENKPPEEVVARLNTYLNEMTKLIFQYGGTLDKYLGDGLMAVFGAPLELEGHAAKAVACALKIRQAVEELNSVWQEKGQAPLRVGIGINTGTVLVGNVGSQERMDYTVIGEDVNLASRLEGLTKEYEADIIIGEKTWEKLGEERPGGAVITDLGEARVRGFDKPIRIFGLANNKIGSYQSGNT